MPLNRYQLRNEYCLADPDLYRVADKDDPEALLEGVAMAGLVGVLRQLGDLAEFAAEIFHDLHEEVMATAARGHGLIARVQQLEAEFPSIEKTLLSQTSHTAFLYSSGVDWHPSIRMDQDLIAGGDLPRFVMDSYEECRGPPRLFLLDKFDVAGAGACLKRYTDPSFFKVEVASSTITKSEIQREKRTRKVKRRVSRWRNGETPESFPSSHAKLHQLLLEERIDDSASDTEHRVKLKKRELTGSPFGEKAGRSYMNKFLDSCLPEQKVVHEISVNPSMHVAFNDTCESGLEIVEIGTVSPTREMPQTERITSSSPSMEEVVVKPSFNKLNDIIDKETTGVSGPNYESDADKSSSNLGKVENDEDLAVCTEGISEGSVDEFNSNEIASEVDNYMDALATMESENETDPDCRTSKDIQYFSRIVMDSDAKEGQDELRTELLDCESVGNANVLDSGNSSFKNIESFSCSDTVSNLAESTPDGDEAAIAIFSPPASVTDPADVSCHQQSVSQDIPGYETPEHAAFTSTLVAVVETEEDIPKLGDASCSSCLTDLNTSLQSSDTIVSLGTNSVLQAEGDEISSALKRTYPMSIDSNQRWEHQTVDVSGKEILFDSPPKAKDNHLLSVEGHPMDEMACGNSDVSCNAIQDLPTVCDAPEDNCSAKLNEEPVTESAYDDYLLNLVDGAADSPYATSSAGDKYARDSGLPGAEACSEVASLQKNSPICNPGQDIEKPAKSVPDEDHCNPPAKEYSENLSLPIDSGLPGAAACSDVASLQKNLPICNSGSDIGKPAKLLPDEDHRIPSTKKNPENVCLPLDSEQSGYELEHHVSEVTDAGLSPQVDLQEHVASIPGDELSIMGVSTAAENEQPVESVLPVHESEMPPPVSGPLQTHWLPQQLLQDGQEEPGGELEVHSLEDSETYSRETATAEVIDGSSVHFDMSELDPSQTEITSEFLLSETSVAALLSQHTSEPVNPNSSNPFTMEDFNSVVPNEDECSPNVEPVECVAVCLDLAPICLDQSGSTPVCKIDAHLDKTSTEAVKVGVNAASCDDDFGIKDGAILYDAFSVGLPSEDLYSSNFTYFDSMALEIVASSVNRTNAAGELCGDDVALSSKLDCSTPGHHQKLQDESSSFKVNFQQNERESKELPLQHVADLYAATDVNDEAVAPANLESNPFPVAYDENPDLKLVSDGPDSSLVIGNKKSLELIGDVEANQKCIQNLESNSRQTHLPGDAIHAVNGNLTELQVHVENEIDLVTSDSLNGLIRGPQHTDKEISVGGAASDSYSVPPLSQPSVSSLLNHSAEHEYDSTGQAIVPSASSFPQRGMPIAENHASSTRDSISQPMDPSWSGFPSISILPSEINLKEMPPLPPLPPMQWRLGRVHPSFLPAERQMMQNTHGPAQVRAQHAIDGNKEIDSKISKAEQMEYVNPFMSLSTEKDAKFQDISGCFEGYTAGASAGPVPAMANEYCQRNAFHVDSRQDKASFSMPEACTRPENGFQSSETELYHPNSELSEPGPTIESIVSGHIPASTGANNMQVETADLDEQHPPIPSVVEQKFLKPPVQFMPPQALHYEQQLPQGFLAPGEVPAWLSNPSNRTASEDGNGNGTLQKKLPRPRNPLIDAVVALDKSKLRKVERVKSQVVEKTEERDTLLEQIRNKSFNLKPAVKTRPSIQGPKTNLKVAAILQKANTIRQAMAGSDEDDSDDWSDS